MRKEETSRTPFPRETIFYFWGRRGGVKKREKGSKKENRRIPSFQVSSNHSPHSGPRRREEGVMLLWQMVKGCNYLLFLFFVVSGKNMGMKQKKMIKIIN